MELIETELLVQPLLSPLSQRAGTFSKLSWLNKRLAREDMKKFRQDGNRHSLEQVKGDIVQSLRAIADTEADQEARRQQEAKRSITELLRNGQDQHVQGREEARRVMESVFAQGREIAARDELPLANRAVISALREGKEALEIEGLPSRREERGEAWVWSRERARVLATQKQAAVRWKPVRDGSMTDLE